MNAEVTMYDTVADPAIVARLVEEINLGVEDTVADNPEMNEDDIVYEIARNTCYGKSLRITREVFHEVGLYGFTPESDEHKPYCKASNPNTLYEGGQECTCWQDNHDSWD